MATAPEVLAHLSAAGITLELDGDRLLAQPASSLTDAHRNLIRANKADLLRLLTERRRAWDVTEPGGVAWRSCYSPPQTWAEVLSRYAPGTVAVPVEDPDRGEGLPADVVEAVTRYLDALGETCPLARAEAVALARARPSVRAIYQAMARPGTPPGPNREAPGPTGTDPKERNQ